MEKIKCPNCNSEIYSTLDEWGRTPFHLHCDNCSINIGATSINKCIELFKEYHKEGTYIEFYSNQIQLWFEEGKLILCQEKI